MKNVRWKKFLPATVTALATVGAVAFAATDQPTTSASNYASAYSAADQAVGVPFTFQNLSDLANHYRSLDLVIPHLPPRYLQHFALMMASGSLQSASPQSPRVISYGGWNPSEDVYPGKNSDRLYLAFQSDMTKTSKLPNSLEAIEWHPENHSYQFYQIDFSDTAAPTVETNPAICKRCHGDPLGKGNPLRPNWTAYPRWDGAFGNDNNVTGAFVSPSGGIDQFHQNVLDTIATLQKNNDRLKPLDFGEYFVIKLENPNANLSEKIGGQLTVRDADLLRTRPEMAAFKYALAGAFLECANFKDFFSSSTLQQLQTGVFANLRNLPKVASTQVASANDLTFDRVWAMTQDLIQRNGSKFTGYGDIATVTTWLRFMLEGQGTDGAILLKNLLGTPPADSATPSWSYDFVNFGSDTSRLRDVFLDYTPQSGEYRDVGDVVDTSDSEETWRVKQYNFRAMVPVENGPAAQMCQVLADKSRAATQGITTQLSAAAPTVTAEPIPAAATLTADPGSRPDPQAALPLFKKYCASCHESADYPPLPLDNLNLLGQYRMDDGRDVVDRLSAQQMPPSFAPAHPTPDERSFMIDALH